MKNRWKRSLMAVILCVGLVLSLSVLGGMAGAVDLERECSVTVHYPTSNIAGIREANIVADFYKIADAVEQDGYDGFDLRVSDPAYAAIQEDIKELSAMDADKWAEVANKAAVIALTGNKEKTAEGKEVEVKLGGFDCGLYLMILRGSDEEEYYTIEDGEVVTTAHCVNTNFSFKPEVIVMPTQEVGAEGLEWIYDQAVHIKAEADARLGSLEIVKKLNRFAASSDATFVFDIEATLGFKKVYSDVVSMVFDKPGVKTLLVEDCIPVGADVTVTEVYSGSVYKLVSSATQTAVIQAPSEPTASVSFENDYSGADRDGSSITNEFTYGDDGILDSVNQRYSGGGLNVTSNSAQ